ncbi:MAG: polysaccharide pyruvyl transferase family protein [Spirochaetaceae bacterium]|nr:polysaccharide pyruvyl transferase family protein [Spirochaetaceae bacterium]
MKIGIMTFWWSNDNYGQLLQCYALQKYLRDAGHDAYLIRYEASIDKKTPLYLRLIKSLNLNRLVRYMKFHMYRKNLNKENSLRHFDDFRNKYIQQSEVLYTTYNQLKDNPPQADCCIVGSDQVWNFSWISKVKNHPVVHAYMLDFGTESTKRMSYAASWSVHSLSRKLIDEIKPLLQKFSYVSVREENGIELCRQCGYESAELVCDPTFLLEADVYRTLYQSENVQKQEQKYLFLYMLNNQCDFDIQKVYGFAADRQLKVVYVTGNGVLDKREKCFATIPEWLSLVDNAEYVVTNSFHCCVFSSLFGKKFGVVKLKGKYAGMNTRMESLFNQLEIASRWLQEDFSVLDKEYKPNPVKISQRFLELLNATH